MDCCDNHDHQHSEKNHDHQHEDCDHCDHQAMDHDHAAPQHSDHSSHMSSPQAAGDFLRRFWTVTALLVPLLLLTPTSLGLLGLADFALRPYLQFLIASIIFWFSQVFFQHAKHEIQVHQYGMMTLVSIAVGAGYLFSAAATFLPSLEVEFYLEISTLIWVLLFGHYLEAKSSTAAGDALGEVAKLLPKQAHLLKDGHQHDVAIAALNEGDVVMIKPGEKVPADGVIAQGEANFNEALISGEAKPVFKKKGDRVVAGAICLDGSVQVKLDKVGENSTVGQIQELVKQAQHTKPSAQSLADKAAGWLTFVALTVATLTLLVWSVVAGESLVFAITLAITVLVIACPHALGLAIPTVSTIATTLAVKNGLFVKNLKKLEIVKDLDYVIFDKTGTLTEGSFRVTKIIGLAGSQETVIKLAASLEKQSAHVIGQSIIRYAKEKKTKTSKVTGFKDISGKGIQGKIGKQVYYLGNKALLTEHNLWNKEAEQLHQQHSQTSHTVVTLATEGKVLGMIMLADEIKPTAKETIDQLHELGIKTAMLTGDNQQAAQAVAEELEIDDYFAEVLPENKYTHVQGLQAKGNKVMMVGDGVNDAPALTQADVGVAIGAGTDVAVEAGDVVLTRNQPRDIVNLVILARKVYRKMIENLIWALGYNIIAIPAAAGVFIPWGFRLRPDVGALLMSLSSVIVVINALALKRINLKN